MDNTSIIRTGDKFLRDGKIFEVIGTKPGGKVELLNRKNSIFIDKWHKDILKWERCKSFLVEVLYVTNAGNPSSKRAEIVAKDAEEAMNILHDRVKKFKSCMKINSGDCHAISN